MDLLRGPCAGYLDLGAPGAGGDDQRLVPAALQVRHHLENGVRDAVHVRKERFGQQRDSHIFQGARRPGRRRRSGECDGEFITCSHGGNRCCTVWSPFTRGWYSGAVIDDLLAGLATGPWVLPLLFVLVFGDAFLIVVPGEAAVTGIAALSVVHGEPPLAAVVVVAAVAAFAGDAACYAIGRTIGVERWRWMRAPRVVACARGPRHRLAAQHGDVRAQVRERVLPPRAQHVRERYFRDVTGIALSRRGFLTAAAAGTALVLGSSLLGEAPSASATAGITASGGGLKFRTIDPVAASVDEFTVPAGYDWRALIRWGDPLFDPPTGST